MPAFAADYAGSMICFGSSAGVAVTSVFPDAGPVARSLGHGWHVAVAYVVGFAVMLAQLGWHLHAPLRGTTAPAAAPHE